MDRITNKNWHVTKFSNLDQRKVLHRLWELENEKENENKKYFYSNGNKVYQPISNECMHMNPPNVGSSVQPALSKKQEDFMVLLFEESKKLKSETDQLKIKNDSLYKKIAELEQDLIHADENVSYRECAVKLDEDKIKKQAQIDILERVKSLTIYDDNYLDGYVFIDDINDLIEEVKSK